VEKTHGQKTAEALDNILETGGNAVKIIRAPKEELIKNINSREP
jgi:hypothetical protein